MPNAPGKWVEDPIDLNFYCRSLRRDEKWLKFLKFHHRSDSLEPTDFPLGQCQPMRHRGQTTGKTVGASTLVGILIADWFDFERGCTAG